MLSNEFFYDFYRIFFSMHFKLKNKSFTLHFFTHIAKADSPFTEINQINEDN